MQFCCCMQWQNSSGNWLMQNKRQAMSVFPEGIIDYCRMQWFTLLSLIENSPFGLFPCVVCFGESRTFGLVCMCCLLW